MGVTNLAVDARQLLESNGWRLSDAHAFTTEAKDGWVVVRLQLGRLRDLSPAVSP